MTACLGYREDMIAFLDEGLATGDRRALESHLAGCPECSEELARQRRLSGALASLPQVEASPQFEARFWARLAREREDRGQGRARLREWLTSTRLAVALGGAAAVAVSALLLGRAPADPDPDWLMVADADSYEILQEGELELLDVLEILEAWDGIEDI